MAVVTAPERVAVVENKTHEAADVATERCLVGRNKVLDQRTTSFDGGGSSSSPKLTPTTQLATEH